MLLNKHISKNLQTLNIFSIDIRLKRALIIFSFCCQLISGFSEYIGIAPFLIDILKPFFSSAVSTWIGNVLALSLALFLEFLVYFLVGFIIYAIRAKYLLLKGDKIDQTFNKIKFWSAIVLLFILVGISMFLSKRNIKYQIAVTKFNSEIIDLDQFDLKEKGQLTIIENRYLADKTDLDDSYNDGKTLIENSFQSKQEAINQQIKILERKEQRTGQSYTTRKTFYKKEIANLYTKRTDNLLDLRRKFDISLLKLKEARDAAISSVTVNIISDKHKARGRNNKTEQANIARNEWVGFILQLIASFSVLGFVIARSWVCMSEVTTGIKEQVLPLQENFGSNFFKEFYLLCRLSIQRKLQNRIRAGLAKIPDLRELSNTGAVLDIYPSSSKNDTNKKHDYHKLFDFSNDKEDYSFSKNLNNTPHITETIAITATSTENDIVASLENKSRVHVVLDDLSSAPKNEDKKEILSGQIVGDKNCLNCSKPFQYKNKKKKYCSDLCRQLFWEKKNGKKLKRGRVKE